MGTTADAVRHELVSGLPTSGKFLLTKAAEYSNGLSNLITRGTLTEHDRLVAQSLLNHLHNALRGVP